MFRPSERLSNPGRADSKRYLKRAGLFAAGLVLLWVALQLLPKPTAETPVYSDDTGSVAASEQVRPTYQGPRLFTFGNLAAFILLVGGGGFAVYMQKRSGRAGGTTTHIESIGELGIAQGQQLRLIRVGGEVLLIGATAHEITLLRDFDPALFDEREHEDDDEYIRDDVYYEESSPRLPVRTSSRGSGHFADVLRQYAGRYVNTQSTGSAC